MVESKLSIAVCKLLKKKRAWVMMGDGGFEYVIGRFETQQLTSNQQLT